MMTGEGKTGLREMLFGSTSMHLMRKCPCPVWVMNPVQPEHFSHILAAVDPNKYDQERSNLNIKIMDLATSLALREQSELIIIHAWKHYLDKYVQSGRVKVSKTTYDQWVEDLRNERRRSLKALIDGYNLEDINYKVYLLRGDADKMIPDLAKAREIELIVMGTVCRTGLAGFLIGNTAEKILRKVNCSVLTIKPDGFITPVNLDS
jgi:nucleotide-binding universal stress UspA family protein